MPTRLYRWSTVPLRIKGLLVVALPVLPLACFWTFVAINEWRQPPPANTIARKLEVQAGLARVLNALLEADSGARDYLFTRNAGARARYRSAMARLDPALADLERLIIDSDLQRSVDALRGLTGEAVATLAGLAGEPVAGTPPLGERASLNRSADLMERIRAVIATIEARQVALAAEDSAEAERAQRDLLLLLSLGSILCTAGGVTAAVLLVRGISRRHAVFADNVGRLARGESPRPMPAGDEEIAWLDAQFRDAAHQLRQREAELQEAVRRLETANAELESFSYSVSHDLRAPLRAIAGFSQILEEDCGDRLDEDGRDSLRRIRAAATRMGLLIDDLLALSRITRMDVHREHVDVSAVAAAVVADLEQRAPDRAVDVRIAPGISAEADPRMVRIALENLLENAWKFTTRTDRPQIELGAVTNGGPLIYYVRDNGAGFDMQQSHLLFNAFQRLHSDQEFTGSGIGLTTVQRIVHRHGGRIWADAMVNAGAAFYFTLEPQEAAR